MSEPTHDLGCSPWLEYVERYGPDLRARFRPADPARIDALEQARGRPLVAPHREFLRLVGGNERGELGPLLANLDFGIGWLEERHASRPIRALDLSDQPGWSCLFRCRTPHLHAEYLLVPGSLVDTYRVAMAPLDATEGSRVDACNASLLEYLMLDAHCFLRREACENKAVFIVKGPGDPSEQRGRTRHSTFTTIVTNLDFVAVRGTGAWWRGYEREDAAMWCYVGPEGHDFEVAMMADDPRRFREYFNILEDNLALHRIR